MQARLLFLHALSPLHVGTGQGVGVIDLPVAREKPTGIPIVPGSSLKGVLRSSVKDEDLRKKVFGPDTTAAHEHAGSVQFGDLHLLFLPVRSLRGTFAWVTSPFLLRRFARDLAWTQNGLVLPQVPSLKGENVCFVPAQPASTLPMAVAGSQKVILEDLDLTAVTNQALAQWAATLAPAIWPQDSTWKTLFQQRICLVHDNLMRFLLETALEVTARIRLNEETKTVEQGALWYEEALPSETIMAGLMFVTPVAAAHVDATTVITTIQQAIQSPLQLGGNATVGRGLCRLSLL